jgi:electron transfer flavoprotein-quinone oxidoreductase
MRIRQFVLSWTANLSFYRVEQLRHLLNLYPHIMSATAQIWLRVDGKAKKAKESEIIQRLRKQRGLRGVLVDGWRFARAWR